RRRRVRRTQARPPRDPSSQPSTEYSRTITMTAPHIVDPVRLLGEALADASPDLMRELLQTMINALLCADADAVVGAEYGRPSPSRTALRNAYRHRALDTRVGTNDVAIRKLRKGTDFPEWLLVLRKCYASDLVRHPRRENRGRDRCA